MAESFVGNYTGPYWSDGKFQESVEFGEADAKNELDELSRLHDSAYAKYKDRSHREAADEIYNREAKKLVGKFPALAGNLVQYGNYTGRQLADTYSMSRFGLPGLIFQGLKNIYQSHQMLTGNYLKKEKQEIEDYYKTDPKKGNKLVGGLKDLFGVGAPKVAPAPVAPSVKPVVTQPVAVKPVVKQPVTELKPNTTKVPIQSDGFVINNTLQQMKRRQKNNRPFPMAPNKIKTLFPLSKKKKKKKKVISRNVASSNYGKYKQVLPFGC
nr:hypothetical protein [Sobelivirales sp.]